MGQFLADQGQEWMGIRTTNKEVSNKGIKGGKRGLVEMSIA